MKDKGLYIGIGLLIGIGIGFLSFKKINVSNIGNIQNLTITKNFYGNHDGEGETVEKG